MTKNQGRQCALCDRPAAEGSILCKRHRELARRQTEQLEKEYRRLTMEVELESYDA